MFGDRYRAEKESKHRTEIGGGWCKEAGEDLPEKEVLHNDRNEAVPRRRGSEHVETWKGVQAERGCKHQALRLRACLVSLKPLWLEGGEWESEP